MYLAEIVLDSVSPLGHRLCTMKVRYPRFIHSEIMTHRDRARNAASSRAIPWKKKAAARIKGNDLPKNCALAGRCDNGMVEYYVANCMYSMIMTEPVIPLSFGLEQRGMQSGEELQGEARNRAEEIWLNARDNAVRSADALASLGVHKSICNRLTEPFMWITVLMTATEWKNFYRLRCHPAAEKHFFHIANMMKKVYNESVPRSLDYGQWHMPYIGDEDWQAANLLDFDTRVKEGGITKIIQKVSAARCARLSYLTQDGKRNIIDDLKLANTLIHPPGDTDEDIMHASPFEHVATPGDNETRSGPFVGWHQFRKTFTNENIVG